MAKEEDDVGSRVDENPASTLTEEVLSCADATRVIMWLKLVGESKENAFWKKIFFPPNVWVSLSSTRPQFASCTEEDRGGMNFIY